MRGKQVSRRLFVVDGARMAGGTALAVGLLGTLSSCQSSPSAAASGAQTVSASPTAVVAPEWPWPYAELDPKVVAEKAYAAYYEAGCMYGAYAGLIGALRDKVGHPYTLIPVQMARYGEGGVVGWATLCGALNGSALAVNLVSKDYSKVVNDLMDWYTETSFPTYTPATPKVNIEAKSVCNSPLCHVSVTEWVNVAKVKAESPERAERCARLTADVAAHTAELLNAQAAGTFQVTYTPAASIAQCGGCHLKGGTLENARGKMDCVDCHDPHIK